MSDPRYDKVNPEVGLFRAALASAISGGAVSASGGYGPVAVSLNASGQVVIGTAGNSGYVGVLVKNFPLYPRMGNIPGQVNIAVPIGGEAGSIVDVMTAGEITNVNNLTAGTTYYAATDGTLSTNPADGPLVGWTVEATRLVVRSVAAGTGGAASGGASTSSSSAITAASTETALVSYSLDANEVVAGSMFKLEAFGVVTLNGTQTLTITDRLGGTAGTSLAASSASALSAVTAQPFKLTTLVNFHSATKAVASTVLEINGIAPVVLGSSAEVTVDTTTAKALVTDLTWGTGSANSLTVLGTNASRVA